MRNTPFATPAGWRTPAATLEAARADYPNAKVIAQILVGEASSRVEIRNEATPVLRTDLKIGERAVTLWANSPSIPPKR